MVSIPLQGLFFFGAGSSPMCSAGRLSVSIPLQGLFFFGDLPTIPAQRPVANEFQSLSRDYSSSGLSPPQCGHPSAQVGFNPSPGIILLRGSPYPEQDRGWWIEFQSLSRDYSSSGAAGRGHAAQPAVLSFNPSPGIILLRGRP